MKNYTLMTCALVLATLSHDLSAAIVLDRTRAIYPASAKSISLNITNESADYPYLAQAWMEDSQGNKVNGPFAVLPPVQRIDAKQKGIVRIAAVAGVEKLPQDRESVYYFNLREIPPKSDKPNVLQLAVQSRIKLFYRPAVIVPERGASWQDQVKVTVKNHGRHLKLENPTPYYITYVGVNHINGKESKAIEGFNAVMLDPKSTQDLTLPEAVGNRFSLSYVNDYGGYIDQEYQCQNDGCQAVTQK